MKFLILATILLLPTFSIAANSSIPWQNYQIHAIQAKRHLRSLEESNYITLIDGQLVVNDYLNLAARAERLKRYDIASWDFNNAAFAEIIVFKKLIRYDQLQSEINQLPTTSPLRKIKINELKQKIAAKESLIASAYVYLGSAAVDNSLNDPNVQEKIDSNRLFLETLNEFITNQK